ncbi:glycosyltransferase [Nocardioides donggukensis]|nr:glycosyltransferase [Nocardioides donggukensis]
MRVHRPQPLRSRPTVAVVIPCYNYGHFLPDAVASALDQDGVDVEVLIVDDASTDDSADVARSLAEADARVRVLVHPANTGHIQTYNDGLAVVGGDYVALLSADDLLTPNSLTRAAALMEHHPSVGLVYGFARSFSDHPPATSGETRNWSVWKGDQWLRTAARKGRCFLQSPEALMRREALDQTDLYDPRLPHSGDFDMWMRTAATWDIGRVNGPAQALYREHANNMHLTTYAGWLTDLRERRTTFQVLFDEREPDRPDVQALRPVAARALAREAVRRALAAHRELPDSGEAEALMAFAATTDPTIRRTVRWRGTRLVLRPTWPAPASLAHRFGERVRMHLTWRYWRRYGT